MHDGYSDLSYLTVCIYFFKNNDTDNYNLVFGIQIKERLVHDTVNLNRFCLLCERKT